MRRHYSRTSIKLRSKMLSGLAALSLAATLGLSSVSASDVRPSPDLSNEHVFPAASIFYNVAEDQDELDALRQANLDAFELMERAPGAFNLDRSELSGESFLDQFDMMEQHPGLFTDDASNDDGAESIGDSTTPTYRGGDSNNP
jgi:hypothetical protein